MLSADFNGDGVDDFVYRDTSTGEVSVLLLSNNRTSLGVRPIATVPNQSWQIVDVGDYDGDDDPDLLWRNLDTGRLLVWCLEGRKIEDFRSLPFAAVPWEFVATAERAGATDGTHNLLWRHPNDGRLVLWIMNGQHIQQTVRLSRETNRNWQVVGMSQVRGDHPVDTEILWRNRVTGENRLWRIESSRLRVAIELQPVGPAWRVGGYVKATDTSPGRIFWQNTLTGQVVQWRMGSNHMIDTSLPYPFDANTQRRLIAGG